jgi:hypothetical protein
MSISRAKGLTRSFAEYYSKYDELKQLKLGKLKGKLLEEDFSIHKR